MVQLFTNKIFSHLLYCAQEIAMILSALFSLRSIGNKAMPKYMENFYWYPMVAGFLGICNLIAVYTSLISDDIFILINRITIPFHFAFLGWFILKVLSRDKLLRTGKIIFYLFLALNLLSLLSYGLTTLEQITLLIANFGLSLLAGIYYFYLFDGPPIKNLIDEPSFWIISGIFIGLCPSIPVGALEKYYHAHLSHEVFLAMGNFGFTCYVVMYSFFIKAYLCAYKFTKINEVKSLHEASSQKQ